MAAAAPPAAVPFALAPSLVDNDPIDYSRPAGIKLYKANTEPFPVKFDGEPKNLRLFLEQVKERARTANWDTLLTVLDSSVPPVGRDLVSEFGMVSLANVTTHAQVYIGQPTRAAQNSSQLYECLTRSLTEEAKMRAINNRSQYIVTGTPDGPLFLKTLIMLSHIDTRATSAHIRKNLSSLDTYMSNVSSDIVKFNEYVKLQVVELAARGEQSNDLLVNLFKGYAMASDRIFVEYVSKKLDLYEEGADMDPSSLMALAENKFKSMKQDGRWNAISEEGEQIIALKAEVEAIKALNKKNRNPKTREHGNSPGRKRVEPWQLVKPEPGEPHKKHHEGSEYFWCAHHHGWFTSHGTKNCRKPKKDAAGANQHHQAMHAPAIESAENKQNLQLSKALSTIVEDEGAFHDE